MSADLRAFLILYPSVESFIGVSYVWVLMLYISNLGIGSPKSTGKPFSEIRNCLKSFSFKSPSVPRNCSLCFIQSSAAVFKSFGNCSLAL